MTSDHYPWKLRQPSILVVDDTPSNLHLLAHALGKNYEVMVATSGKAALELLKGQRKPDLILLDVMMPAMDGHDVCQQLKAKADTRAIPIIFVTARDAVEDQQLGFNLGAVDYITKPFDIPLVMARVAVHIRLKLKSERLEELAMFDGLTDIANRRALDEFLRRECGRSARDGSPLAVLMIDIDHFKDFNDHYGHGAGDECLRRVAHCLQETLRRPGDFVARYGGEEFCVVLPNCDATGALQVAESIRSAVSDLGIPHGYSSVAHHVTVSLGGAVLAVRSDEDGFAAIQRKADAALYAAKARGRNRVVLGN